MTNRLRIDRLEWDWWNLEHIRKHDVTKQEVEEVAASDYIEKDSYRNQHVVTGRTLAGSVLALAVGQVPEQPNVYYVFSARPASRKERRELEGSTS